MAQLDWSRVQAIPAGVRAVLAALAMEGTPGTLPSNLSEAEWAEALRFCDRGQLTLLLAYHFWDSLPEPVRERLSRNFAGQRLHSRHLRDELLSICARLDAGDIDYLVLKGFSCQDNFSAAPSLRVQYDIDLFCPGYAMRHAYEAIRGMGYEPFRSSDTRPTDHLPVLVRKTDWRWRGDYFDPEIPPSVDLHFRFWDEKTECLPAPGVEQFWLRRERQPVQGADLPVLSSVDALGYAALHLLRHLLRGSVRPYHVYELAYFLDHAVEDSGFWREWAALHPPALRRLQAISFALAGSWFGCRLATSAREEVERLPEVAQQWFERCAAAPVQAMFEPNKEEVWLHLSLLDSTGAKARVLRRRMLPLLHRPGAAGVGHALSRLRFHAVSLPRTLWRALDRWLDARSPGFSFLRFLAAASIYNLGAFVFFLLYNLYLLDLGYQEKFLGMVAGAVSVGNIAGALLAAWIAGRVGLKNALALGFGATGLISTTRCLVAGATSLLGTAFLGGVAAAFWFVLFAPAISSLAGESRRPLAFSLFVASGVGMGVIGGIAGGQLPGMFQGLFELAGPAEAKRAALLSGCALCLLASWIVRRLPLSAPAPSTESRIYNLNPFVVRFLVAAGVWSAALGTFDPFLNAYLARAAHADVSQIGWLFSVSHILQAGAVLLAPLVLRRYGLVGGVVSMQLATAAALASLAAGPPLLAAGSLCAIYKSFQAMCEPGTYSLLMGQVSPAERTGTAALNFLVLFATQAAAAAASGAAISRFGYPAVLWAAAGLAIVAAVLFRTLLGGSAAAAPAESSRAVAVGEQRSLS